MTSFSWFSGERSIVGEIQIPGGLLRLSLAGPSLLSYSRHGSNLTLNIISINRKSTAQRSCIGTLSLEEYKHEQPAQCGMADPRSPQQQAAEAQLC